MKIANKHFENMKNFGIFGKETTKSKLRAQKHKEKMKFGECLQAFHAEYRSPHSLSKNTEITI